MNPIPDIDWAPEPLASIGTAATFHPITCFIESELPSLDVELKRWGSGSIDGSVLGNVTFFHEFFHWIQFQTTTIGQLLFGIRHARERLVFEAAVTNDDFRSVLFAPSRESAIATYATPDSVVWDRFDKGSASTVLDVLDLERAYRLLYLPNLAGPDVLGDRVLSRALYLVSVLETGKSETPSTENLVSSDPLEITCTTQSILELSAYVMEATMLLAARELDRQVLEHLVFRIRSECASGRASAFVSVADMLFEAFTAVANTADSRTLYGLFLDIAVVCELALNPPVPPICEVQPISASDLLPPTRFGRGIDAMVRLGGQGELSHESYLERKESIASEAKLPLGTVTQSPSGFEWLERNPDYGQIIDLQWEFLRCSSKRILHAMKDLPEYFVHFGALASGHRSESLARFAESVGKQWYLPPVYVSPDGLQGFHDNRLAKLFAQSVACSYSLKDLFAGKSDLPLGVFPHAYKPELRSAARSWMQELFGQ